MWRLSLSVLVALMICAAGSARAGDDYVPVPFDLANPPGYEPIPFDNNPWGVPDGSMKVPTAVIEPPAGVVGVPEPSGLLLLGAAVLLRRGRRRG